MGYVNKVFLNALLAQLTVVRRESNWYHICASGFSLPCGTPHPTPNLSFIIHNPPTPRSCWQSLQKIFCLLTDTVNTQCSLFLASSKKDQLENLLTCSEGEDFVWFKAN